MKSKHLFQIVLLSAVWGVSFLMMREALMSKTSDIAEAAEHSTPSLAGVLANNTIGAVSRGAVFALAGLADRAAEIIEQSTGIKPKLFITGGDAGMITGTMRSRGQIVPDLVLQGLAVIASQSIEESVLVRHVSARS